MKIRHKNDHSMVVDSVFWRQTSDRCDGGCWSTPYDKDGVLRHYEPTIWEEVPDEPKLVDVTELFHLGEAECWENHRQVIQGCGQDVVLGKGYEWRKIQAYVILDIPAFNRDFIHRRCGPEECLQKYKQPVLQVWESK